MSIRQKLQRFMMGRNGVDQLSQALFIFSIALLIINLLTKWNIFYILAIGALIYSYFRMLSKNISKRYAENQILLTWRYRMTANLQVYKDRFKQSKTHHFYKCPDCKQTVRVPRGKGKICITCPKCKTEFIKKS